MVKKIDLVDKCGYSITVDGTCVTLGCHLDIERESGKVTTLDGIEKLLAAHVRAGVDVLDPAYTKGLEEALGWALEQEEKEDVNES